MPGENILDWSTTAASNGSADTSINFAEGQTRASLNDSCRSVMAAIAKDRNLKNGSITTGGTVNAQTFSSGLTYISVPSGLRVTLKVGAALTNTAAMTLNMDGIGAVAVKNMLGTDLIAGDWTAGGYVDILYDGTNWILLRSVVSQAGWILLSTQTVAAGAQIAFTTGLDSTYDEYKIIGQGILPSTDNQILFMQFSQDGGSTWKAAGGYKWAAMVVFDGTTVVSPVSASAGDRIEVSAGQGLSSTAARPCYFEGTLVMPSSTTVYKSVYFDVQHYQTANFWINTKVSGVYVTDTAAVNAVRFLAASGNISGTARLYGIKKYVHALCPRPS
jgi:hypothetical protein